MLELEHSQCASPLAHLVHRARCEKAEVAAVSPFGKKWGRPYGSKFLDMAISIILILHDLQVCTSDIIKKPHDYSFSGYSWALSSNITVNDAIKASLILDYSGCSVSFTLRGVGASTSAKTKGNGDSSRAQTTGFQATLVPKEMLDRFRWLAANVLMDSE